LLQSSPHLVSGEAALLCEKYDDTANVPGATCCSNNALHWGTASPVQNSACQHSVNADATPTLFDTAAAVHQMALRPPSDLDPTLVCDAYNPELDATENPEYFHINSLLFAAHQLRTQRHPGQSFFCGN